MVTFSMPPEHSGAAKQAIALASRLMRAGAQIFFVTMRSTDASIGVDEVSGFRVVRVVKQTVLQKALAPERVFRVLFRERDNFDVLHVHGVGYLSTVSVLFGRLFGKSVIVKMTMFGEDDALSVKGRRFGAITFAFLSRASRLIAITGSFRRSCVAAGIPALRVAQIPNGVDTERFRPLLPDAKLELRRSLELPADATLLAYAGIARPDKGIDFLLDVVALLGARRRDVQLVLLCPIEAWLPEAERAYARAMLDRIHGGEFKELIHFHAGVANVNEYFQAADIFVSASSKEGFPNVLLEAMASGLVPVVLEVPEVHVNVLEDSIDSFVVRRPDRREFAAKVTALVEDKSLRSRLAAAATTKARSRYSLDRVAAEYLTLYAELSSVT